MVVVSSLQQPSFFRVPEDMHDIRTVSGSASRSDWFPVVVSQARTRELSFFISSLA
jgi:hypothetical protein